MKDVLLSSEQVRQIRRLKFEPAIESAFQETASQERIRRIQVVVIAIVVLFLAAPSPKEVSATPLMRQVAMATSVLTLLMLVLVFLPKFRRVAVFALPVWDVFQQVAFGLAAPNPLPFMQATIQLALSIVIIAAVRAPAKLSLAYVVLTLALRVGDWNRRGYELSTWAGPLSFLVFGLVFLVIGSILTEIADRKSFLVSRLLEEERAKTQALLTNVLPAEIAESLKNSSAVIATNHPSASVLFGDVVNFTPYAASKPASEVVGFLNDLFSRFDLLVGRSGLEKIKTVGDAYMVASGLPTYRDDHLAALADLALEMRGAAAAMGADVRFGLHTGPVVAGVIGTQKYMYDLWGSTVNLAARLESSSSPGEIQVSQAVRDALLETHEFRELGMKELKGVGETMVYVLLRRTVKPVEVS